MISLVPPKGNEIVKPARDVIFLVDHSGSMSGLKMMSAARACSYLLSTLGPGDRFAIQAFDDSVSWLVDKSGQQFIAADEEGIDKGTAFLRKIEACGGTELKMALDDAITVMSQRPSKIARMPVFVLLTDGQVGDESEILKHIQSKLSDGRIFTVGIDTAVNDGLLRRLASIGGGTAAFVAPGAQLEAALAHVGREIGAPLITDIVLTDVNCGLELESLAPQGMPDLFEGRAINVFFRLTPKKVTDLSSARVKIKGKYSDGNAFETEVNAQAIDVQALPQLWAKARVTDLTDQYRVSGFANQDALQKEIVAIAVEHSLLTKFTAFVVVDHSEVVNENGVSRKLVQPVSMPAQWAEAEQVQTGSSFAAINLRQLSQAGEKFGAPSAMQMPQSQPVSASADDWGCPAPSNAPMTLAESIKRNIANSQSGAALPPPSQSHGPTPGWSAPQSQMPPANMPAPQSQLPAKPGFFDRLKTFGQPSSSQNNAQQQQYFSLGEDAMDTLFKENLGSSQSAAQQSNLSGASIKDELNVLLQTLAHLKAAIKQIVQNLKDGKLEDIDELDTARAEMLQALAESAAASKLPRLQKYLRSDLLQLLAALSAAENASPKLEKLASDHELKIEEVGQELLDLISGQKPNFWQATV